MRNKELELQREKRIRAGVEQINEEQFEQQTKVKNEKPNNMAENEEVVELAEIQIDDEKQYEYTLISMKEDDEEMDVDDDEIELIHVKDDECDDPILITTTASATQHQTSNVRIITSVAAGSQQGAKSDSNKTVFVDYAGGKILKQPQQHPMIFEIHIDDSSYKDET